MSGVGAEPAVRRRDAVLVTGPPLAGATGVAVALRDHLSGHTVVESAELRPGEAPVAVVFVVSATAPLTESDCALLDDAAAWTEVVIGVVTKTDVHRTWREVLRADRTVMAARRPRYAGMRWVGAAAVPDIGPPNVDEVVEVLRTGLADPTLDRRNELRLRHSQLSRLSIRHERAACDGRVAVLREQRDALITQRRLDKSRQTIALRSHCQQARLRLSYVVRNRCASVRADLQHAAAVTTRRTRAALVTAVRHRVSALVDQVDGLVTEQLTAVAKDLGPPAVDMPAPPAVLFDVPAPPPRAPRLETRLTTLLGAGFGLGAALTLSRLLTGIAPGPAAAVVCVVAGVALTAWTVGTRGLLQDRAVLDRWVTEVLTALRATLEERVATRVLAAESVFGGAAAERDVAAGARVDRRVAVIDRQIRAHTAARARALAARDRQLPVINRALAEIDAELAGCARAGRSARPADRPAPPSESFL